MTEKERGKEEQEELQVYWGLCAQPGIGRKYRRSAHHLLTIRADGSHTIRVTIPWIQYYGFLRKRIKCMSVSSNFANQLVESSSNYWATVHNRELDFKLLYIYDRLQRLERRIKARKLAKKALKQKPQRQLVAA